MRDPPQKTAGPHGTKSRAESRCPRLLGTKMTIKQVGSSMETLEISEGPSGWVETGYTPTKFHKGLRLSPRGAAVGRMIRPSQKWYSFMWDRQDNGNRGTGAWGSDS